MTRRTLWLALAVALVQATATAQQTPARDLNRATAAQLDSVPRVGPALAARLVARRDSLGGFARWSQVDSTKGIGPKLLAALQARFQIAPTKAAK